MHQRKSVGLTGTEYWLLIIIFGQNWNQFEVFWTSWISESCYIPKYKEVQEKLKTDNWYTLVGFEPVEKRDQYVWDATTVGTTFLLLSTGDTVALLGYTYANILERRQEGMVESLHKQWVGLLIKCNIWVSLGSLLKWGTCSDVFAISYSFKCPSYHSFPTCRTSLHFRRRYLELETEDSQLDANHMSTLAENQDWLTSTPLYSYIAHYPNKWWKRDNRYR